MFAGNQYTCIIMAVEIITREDLAAFKVELLSDLKSMLSEPTATPKKWLRSREVMKMLQISPGTLQNYRINGTLQYSRFGSTIFYSREAIERLLEENLQNQPTT